MHIQKKKINDDFLTVYLYQFLYITFDYILINEIKNNIFIQLLVMMYISCFISLIQYINK
ncbi:hypothetical protein A8L45_21090 [Veronia pacifica]|uniref:Uncharacterized protein n=1 Tax=Veronia pacifica TaxID=1080227 RepID=A0A1C3EA96_9GAMM|nr:hypothetical protein A8L45_21090 [Veronia pacifica]